MMVISYKPRQLLTFLLILVGIAKLSLFGLGYFLDESVIFSPDSSSYLQTARAFLRTGEFSISPEHPDVPQLMRTPGYPVFIASLFWLSREENFPMLIVSQIVVSLATIWLTYRLTDMLFDSFAALLSACFLALDIPSFVHSQKLLTETLFTFFLLVTVVLACHLSMFPQIHRKVFAFGLGLALALTTLIRPIAYYLIFFELTGILLAVRRIHGLHWKGKAGIIIAFILPWLVLVGGWQCRNYLLTGAAEFSYIQGVNLFYYRSAGIIAQRDRMMFEHAQRQLGFHQFKSLPPETLAASIATLNKRWKQQSLQLFLTHPWFLFKDMARGFAQMLLMPGKIASLN